MNTTTGTNFSSMRLPLAAVAAAFVPWVWSVGMVPWWISAVSAMTATAALLGLAFAARSRDPRGPATSRAAGDTPTSTAKNLQSFLHRWSGMAHQTQNNLHNVRDQIHGVMEQTEQAVLNLSGSFQNITAKTSEQMNHALNLLQSTHGIALNPEYQAQIPRSPSLPEYLHTSEELVQRLANEIVRYSEMSLKLLLHENEMHVGDRRLDDAIAEVQAALRKIEALAASMRDGAVAGEIASLSQQATALTQDAHARTRTVRDHRANLYRSVAQIAEDAKGSAEAAKAEMVRVASDMRKKNEEVAALVGRINTLGEEVRKDIYKVIVELQFQDITHQKLERVKTPLLNELGQGLRAIAQETHLLYEKLRRSVMDRIAEGAVVEPAPPLPAVAEAVPAHHLQGSYQKPELGNKVELF